MTTVMITMNGDGDDFVGDGNVDGDEDDDGEEADDGDDD